MRIVHCIVGTLALLIPMCALQAVAESQEGVPPGHRCVRDEQGNVVCSRFSGGDAFLDGRTKEIVCGKGHCLMDYYKQGSISCARSEDGVAAYDRKGGVVCSGGCEPASKEMCEKLTP